MNNEIPNPKLIAHSQRVLAQASDHELILLALSEIVEALDEVPTNKRAALSIELKLRSNVLD